MQKQITIIGATAGVGLLTMKQALERGHKVITLSRSVSPLNSHPHLTSIQGSATNSEDLKKAITNSDAVIVTLGTGKSMKATKLYTDFATAVIKAQQETQTNVPFIILTGFGAGNSARYQGFILKTLMDLLLGAIYKNKTEMEEMIAASKIKWEFVRPGLLTNDPLTGHYRVITEYSQSMKIRKISRADVAHYLLNQAENPSDLLKYPALSY